MGAFIEQANTTLDKTETKEQTLERIEKRLKDSQREDLIPLAREMADGPLALTLMRQGAFDALTTDRLFSLLPEHLTPRTPPVHPMDERLLYCPVIQAVQERLKTFQKLLLNLLKNGQIPANSRVASIPCGRMRDLLTLKAQDYSLQLIGIDGNPAYIEAARQLANDLGVQRVEFETMDPLRLNVQDAFNVVLSNGLNIHLDDDAVVDLYKRMFVSLKPDGYFITSHITPPEDWNLLNPEWEQFEKDFLGSIVSAAWLLHRRTVVQTVEQLRQAGFEVLDVLRGKTWTFPTFFARKPRGK